MSGFSGKAVTKNNDEPGKRKCYLDMTVIHVSDAVLHGNLLFFYCKLLGVEKHIWSLARITVSRSVFDIVLKFVVSVISVFKKAHQP